MLSEVAKRILSEMIFFYKFTLDLDEETSAAIHKNIRLVYQYVPAERHKEVQGYACLFPELLELPEDVEEV
ncbi:MAG: hypothetical protein KME29_31260 [Calothrix sp. FI2-JRJ7]|jgi:hypothetical protein|nr:hypothetical protein [Calothrix sp. FI2-JRJ7]